MEFIKKIPTIIKVLTWIVGADYACDKQVKADADSVVLNSKKIREIADALGKLEQNG